MPQILTGAINSRVNIVNSVYVVVAQNATISVNANTEAILIGDGSANRATLDIAGFVGSDVTSPVAVRSDGNDRITITQTGQVSSFGPSNEGIILGGGNNSLFVAGGILATDFAIFDSATGASDPSTITILATGYVTGGEDIGAGNGYSGAILLRSDSGTSQLTNHGIINAEVNAFSGERTAIANAGFDPSGYRGFNEDDTARTNIVNTGIINGDILTQGGTDEIYNSGNINGSVYLGDGVDFYIGRGGLISGGVMGGRGTDFIIGGEQFDILEGGADADSVAGLGGDDLLGGGSGEDTLRGGAGSDDLRGGSNADELHGGSGNDKIEGDSGTDDIFGDSGDDTIDGGTASDTIQGGSGDDDIRGGNQDDLISGQSGDDFIRGENNNDNLGGGSGADTISGGNGNDNVDAGSGDDRVFGGTGNDTLVGSTGDDYINGGLNDDDIVGGSGDDTLIGGAGQDTMRGSSGADIFDFNAVSDSATGSATRDLITDFQSGVDLIDLSDIGSLTFVGSFTGSAGEVRYNDGVGRLYVDIDGDTASDFQIDLGAGTGLTVDDLIL